MGTGMRLATLCGLAVFAASFSLPGLAAATPEFPGVVARTLGLSGITIDPPNGCTLCHPSDSGGTALRSFGTLLQQYGVQPYEDATLVQALAQVGQEDPQLVAYIKAGTDPNDDATAAPLPTPEYGCSASRAAGTSEWASAAASLLAALALSRRRTAPLRKCLAGMLRRLQRGERARG